MTTKKKREAKKLTPYSSIKLLNIPEKDYGASIQTKLVGKITNGGSYNNYLICIRDCERETRLHGSLGSPQDRYNALFKIRTIIDELEILENRIKMELKLNRLVIAQPKDPN